MGRTNVLSSTMAVTSETWATSSLAERRGRTFLPIGKKKKKRERGGHCASSETACVTKGAVRGEDVGKVVGLLDGLEQGGEVLREAVCVGLVLGHEHLGHTRDLLDLGGDGCGVAASDQRDDRAAEGLGGLQRGQRRRVNRGAVVLDQDEGLGRARGGVAAAEQRGRRAEQHRGHCGCAWVGGWESQACSAEQRGGRKGHQQRNKARMIMLNRQASKKKERKRHMVVPDKRGKKQAPSQAETSSLHGFCSRTGKPCTGNF